jgi:anti-sigma regulatory factor (Ser/Thr protein kinase)
MEQITFSIPAQLGFVSGIRTALGRISYNFGFNDKDAYEIETVIDEICNNAIIHGGSNEEARITIECGFDTKIIEIMVKDGGSSVFNVEKALEDSRKLMKDDTERKINTLIEKGGGLGLIIVQKYVDKFEITSQPDGTVVKIAKFGQS